MRIRKLIIGLLFVLNNILAFGQCEYTLVNYTHNDCYGDNNGSIDIALADFNASLLWTFPDGSNSASPALVSLDAGTYYLEITNNGCTLIDSIDIEETIEISANFELSTMCNEYDSADVKTTIWGGTPPYITLWSTGDTARHTTDLAPQTTAYTLTIVDINACLTILELTVDKINEMNSFMSSVGVICKDDYTGSARVFLTEGAPPFQFQWSTDSAIIIEHDSFSVIENLVPGEYRVKITDDMGCITRDTIEVKSNPSICITVYKVFSPNDDDIHEFWEIENIHLYPEALVQVYDRTGQQVYRRRNYINAEEHAFGGKDQKGVTLPSGTYYYIIDLENEDVVFKGALTIVR